MSPCPPAAGSDSNTFCRVLRRLRRSVSWLAAAGRREPTVPACPAACCRPGWSCAAIPPTATRCIFERTRKRLPRLKVSSTPKALFGLYLRKQQTLPQTSDLQPLTIRQIPPYLHRFRPIAQLLPDKLVIERVSSDGVQHLSDHLLDRPGVETVLHHRVVAYRELETRRWRRSSGKQGLLRAARDVREGRASRKTDALLM